jgi:SAM-dependent methyltransferase
VYYTCPICRRSDLTSFEAGRGLVERPVAIRLCCICGFACRADLPDSSSNFVRQLEAFNQSTAMPIPSLIRWPHRVALINRTVTCLVRSPGLALDIGCNTGIWLATLGGKWERYGVELSPIAAGIAESFSGASIYVGPLESYVAPASFDLITAFAVIEHVIDPCFFVQWIYNNMKPGGLMVLMTGDRESTVAQKMSSGWPLYFSPEHVSFFSARSLCQLVEKAGFCIRRKEWRYMPYSPMSPFTFIDQLSHKCAEILGRITAPKYDHFYLYASKP